MRRLLSRIHLYTQERLRSEIEPVTARDFLRFLLSEMKPKGKLLTPFNMISIPIIMVGLVLIAGAAAIAVGGLLIASGVRAASHGLAGEVDVASLARIHEWASWAWSGVAVRPVPIAQTGS